MTTNGTDSALRVAESLCLLLKQGIILDDQVKAYLESIYSDPDWTDLEHILQEASSGELDSLLELIFFPGESMQLCLEPCLEQWPLSEPDEQQVAAQVCGTIQSVLLKSSDGGHSIIIDAPSWALEKLVRRLNITKHIPSSILQSIQEYIPNNLRNRVKVCLRNKIKPLSSPQVQFVKQFIERSTPTQATFWELFQFMVGFLDEIEDHEDIYSALTESKRSWFENLQTVLRMESQHANSNFETMLMQGVRIPYIDKHAARNRLEMIDNVCYTVFGRIEYIGELPAF